MASKQSKFLNECVRVSDKTIKLWESVVDLAIDNVKQEGKVDTRIIKAGMDAAERLTAYAYGQPKGSLELSGVLDVKTTLDPRKLSTDTLRELLEAREKDLALKASEDGR